MRLEPTSSHERGTNLPLKEPRINVNEQPARNLASKLTILTS